MGRSKKYYTTEERLEKITEDIAVYENTLRKLYTDRDELIKLKRQEDAERLVSLIEEKGLSLEEMIRMLENDSFSEESISA